MLEFNHITGTKSVFWKNKESMMKKVLMSVFFALVIALPSFAAYDTAARVPVVGKQIVTKNGLPSTITFKVVDTDADNSSATTSKVIQVSKQDLIYAGNDNEVAAVIAHEIGTVMNAQVSKENFRNLAKAALANTLSEDNIINTAANSEFANNKVSLSDAMDADITGVDLMIGAGYNPLAMVVWVTKMPGSFWESIKGDPSNSKRAMNIYDYLLYNYPSKVKAGYACNEYRFFLTYADPIVEKRNSSEKKLEKFQKEQAKKKSERAKQIARYKATGGVNGWDATYTLLENFANSSEK